MTQHQIKWTTLAFKTMQVMQNVKPPTGITTFAVHLENAFLLVDAKPKTVVFPEKVETIGVKALLDPVVNAFH